MQQTIEIKDTNDIMQDLCVILACSKMAITTIYHPWHNAVNLVFSLEGK